MERFLARLPAPFEECPCEQRLSSLLITRAWSPFLPSLGRDARSGVYSNRVVPALPSRAPAPNLGLRAVIQRLSSRSLGLTAG